MTEASSRPEPPSLPDYPVRVEVQTRWSDNDMFGHVNNVQFYRFFEMAVCELLDGRCRMNLAAPSVMTFAAETGCRFLRPLSWPEKVTAALRIDHVGTSSVRYGLALFGQDGRPAAQGHWVHVFVDTATQRPIPIPAPIRAVFEGLASA